MTTFFSHNLNLFLLIIAALSLFVGSFLNVVIYRLPRMLQEAWNLECREYLGLKTSPQDKTQLNLCLPLSHCTHCKKHLKPWHNIPIISYLILRGKCAYCKTTISVRYPIVEAICCLTSVYVAWRFGVSLQTVGALILTWTLIAMTFIDLDHHLLPDSLTLFLLWVGLLLSLFSVFASPQDAILGAVAGYLVFAITQWAFKLVTGKIGMGQGDFKMLAALGAFLGWQMLPLIIILASLSGLIIGLTHMVIKHQYKSVPLPFGPYLAVAGWVSLIWGKEILHLYWHTFLS